MTLFYIAAIDDVNDVFYQKEATEDIELLWTSVKFVDFEDNW